jgi:putative transposase
VPRQFWLLPEERQAILDFEREHPDEGYRRLAFMMLDADVVAASPSSVYRVLKSAGRIGQQGRRASSKGQGFEQPSRPHEHWHIDMAYLNICGTFYYLCTILDGYSRYIVHWEISAFHAAESMTEADVETILQRAREAFPGERPRLISDNGPQFVAREFKEFVRLCGMTQVQTFPYYPQSNGKVESWHKTVKRECIRPLAPLNLADARRIVASFVNEYNSVRLHSGIGYVTPLARLEGRDQRIITERRLKLAAARQARASAHQRPCHVPTDRPLAALAVA